MNALDACEHLNELHKMVDLTQLVNNRINVDIDANQTEKSKFVFGINKGGDISIGVVGILNGIVTEGRIAACYDDSGKLTGFQVWRG